jgi:hypothetical protein
MSNFGEDCRAWLMAQALTPDPAGRIHHLVAPDAYAGPYLWFRRRGSEHALTLDSAPGEEPFEIYIDLEAIAADEQAHELGEAVARLNAYRGQFGAGTVQAVFIADHADDYQPRGMMSNEALQFVALELQVIGYQPAP